MSNKVNISLLYFKWSSFMNKIIYIFIVTLLSSSSIFAQNNSQNPPPLIEEYLVDYENYASFDKFHKNGEEEKNYEINTYTAITNVLSNLEQDVFRLFYANAESKKTFIDHSRQAAFDSTSVKFNIFHYYDALQYEGLIFLKKAYDLLLFLQDKYDNVKEGLPYFQVNEQEMFDIQVQIKMLQGICSFYMTGKNNLKKALGHFSFLLGQNDSKVIYANTKIVQERVFKYFIAIYNVLLNRTSNLTNIEIDDFNANLLYYKWKLVELLNQDNEDLKDYKLMRLTKNYYFYMPIKSSIFEKRYKPYVIKLYELAKNDQKLEEKLIAKFGETIFSYLDINKTTDSEVPTAPDPKEVESSFNKNSDFELEEGN